MLRLRIILSNIGKQWWFLSFLVLLIIAFAEFTFFQATPSFADPDSFYHVKMAELIPKEGIIKAFPWLQFTILRDSYIDQHFLYHVYLIPFVYLMNPIEGAKLATILLCAGVTILFYWFLRSERIKGAFVYTLVLLGSMPFIFRINLVKAPVLSIILLLFGLHCLFKKKPILLGVVSLLYVWAYGGFVLILVFAGAYMCVSVLYDFFITHRRKNFWKIVRANQEVHLFLFALLGVLVGILVNPQFPQNLVFYWHQLVKIGIVNYQKVISVGNEWYPYTFINLTANTAVISTMLLITFYLFAMHFQRPTKKVITTFIIYLFFFAFTLKSRRYVEYYIPFAIIFSAFGINHFIGGSRWRDLWQRGVYWFSRYRIAMIILIVYFLIVVPTALVKDGTSTYNDLRGGSTVEKFSGASAWLEGHSKDGDIVFHSSWDEFPLLFYHNSKDYYIFGLDPTFSYEYDHALHQKIVDITTGKQTDGLYEDIRHTFRSSFVFVEKGHTAMNANIRNTAGFKEVYADSQATVYQVL